MSIMPIEDITSGDRVCAAFDRLEREDYIRTFRTIYYTGVGNFVRIIHMGSFYSAENSHAHERHQRLQNYENPTGDFPEMTSFER